MRIIDAKAELISEKDPYRKVEMAARVCYKSESKISDESAERMCKGLIKSQHTAMLEHAVFCFEIKPIYENDEMCHRALCSYIEDLRGDDYIHVTVTPIMDGSFASVRSRILVSASARAISQRNVNDPIFRALCAAYPILVWGKGREGAMHLYERDVVATLFDIDACADITQEEIREHKYLTFRFTTDRGVSHEAVRHRPCSFAQESTRYCLYSREQFGGELTFIRPADYDEWPAEKREAHEKFLQAAEDNYLSLVSGEDGLKAQQARADLPTCIKTELVMTANMREWKHIFNLRVHGTTGAPHPDIKFVMQQALDIAMLDEKAAAYLKYKEGE